MSPLTHRQRAIYDFVVRQVRRNGIPPTLMEIADAFGLSSAAGVADHLKAIERKGYIRRRPGASRGIELARDRAPNPARRSIAVPIVAEIPSSRGLAENGALGRVYVDSRLATGDMFAVRATGRLDRRGILPGDLLVTRRADATPGSLVVGSQGQRVLLLEMSGDGRRARSLNGAVDKRREVRLHGPVVAVIRCYEELG